MNIKKAIFRIALMILFLMGGITLGTVSSGVNDQDTAEAYVYPECNGFACTSNIGEGYCVGMAGPYAYCRWTSPDSCLQSACMPS